MSTHPTDPSDAELLRDFMLAAYAAHSRHDRNLHPDPAWFGGEARDMVSEYRLALAELRREDEGK